MSNIKKQQHYVWQQYLRPWADGGSIWTYFKEQDKIIKPGLKGVVQERYFYKPQDLSIEEINFLKTFIDVTSPTVLKDLNYKFLELFTIHSFLKNKITSNAHVNKEFLASEIKRIEVNVIEDAHCIIEDLGSKIIQCRSLEDLKNLSNEENLLDTLVFLCVQYLRTKNRRELVLKTFDGDRFQDLAEKSWNILVFVLATILAYNIAISKKMKFIFIQNNTPNPFLTCDQPIFNILDDKDIQQEEIQDLEFYYPLTPKIAVCLQFRQEQIDNYENKAALEEDVEFLNKEVFKHARNYVFANNEGILKKIVRK